MGTLCYILSWYRVLYSPTHTHTLDTSPHHNAQGKRTHQASEPQRRPGRPGGGQEGREAEPTRGGEAPLGLHQGEEAAGPREQAVLLPRREDEAHLHRGQDQGLRHGQAPQGAPPQLDDEPQPRRTLRAHHIISYFHPCNSPPPSHTVYVLLLFRQFKHAYTHTRSGYEQDTGDATSVFAKKKPNTLKSEHFKACMVLLTVPCC